MSESKVVPLKKRASPEPPPEALAGLPDDDEKLLHIAQELTEVCRSNAGQRSEYYRSLNIVAESGRTDGTKSLVNLMYSLLDRLSSMLFSPTDVKFGLDFENDYDQSTMDRSRVTTRLLARSWERTNTDLQFAQGVFESLKYGATFLKQWPLAVGQDRLPEYRSALLMPWQFGVYRPDLDDLDEQPALVETSLMTLPEVWRRIHRMPDAQKLFERIRATASGNQTAMENSFTHPVLLASQMQFSQPTRPVPGGIVQLGTSGGLDGATASNTANKVLFHEVWVWDRQDYSTIQWIEPDILIAPRYKISNLLINGQDSGLHPYTLIQPNQVHGNIWGRSELADVMLTQDMLSQTMGDVKKLFGLIVDKILVFVGDDISDEKFDQFRASGYANLGPGASVQDLTPHFPAEALPLIDKLIQLIEMVCGFDNLLSGKGETGVRSGVQSAPLMKVASSRLKDRSLIVERQCAKAADLRLSLMEAKDGRAFWTNAKQPEETRFLLTDIPDDRRVVVDSHSSSPVFADEQQQLVAGGLKMGLLTPELAVEMLPFQNKDRIIQALRDKQAQEQALIQQLQQQDPEGFRLAMEKKLSGGGRRR